jgi:hypothetical protein
MTIVAKILMVSAVGLMISSPLSAGSFKTLKASTGSECVYVNPLDFNNDGIPDRVYQDNFQKVVVSLGNGDGTSGPALTVVANSPNPQIRTGDFNNDGKLDVLIATNLYLGQADGTFQAGLPVPLTFGPRTIGDFNLDGTLDIAANQAVLLGNGTGTFQVLSLTGFPFLRSLEAKDLNSDGALDLIGTENVRGFVWVAIGNGDGTFQQPDSLVASEPYLSFATAADLNLDSIPDIIWAADGEDRNRGRVGVLLGLPGGAYGPNLQDSAAPGSAEVVVSDVNADNMPDLAVRNVKDESVSVLVGNGDGTFQPAKSWVTERSESLKIAHCNGDNLPDIIVEKGILISEGDGRFIAARTYSAGGTGASGLVVGDVDGDNFTDIALTLKHDGTAVAFLGSGNDDFPQSIGFSSLNFPISIDLGDFDGDGNSDFLFNNGQLVLSKESGFLTTQYSNLFSIFARAGDFNGDNKTDIAAATIEPSSLNISMGNGDGSFQSEVNYALNGDGWLIRTGLLNGNSLPDLVVQTDSPSAQIFMNNGDGSFNSSTVTGNGVFALGDFNSDGKTDITRSDANLELLIGNGDGTFQPGITIDSGNYGSCLESTDFDGDGILDLVGVGNEITILSGNGDGTFRKNSIYASSHRLVGGSPLGGGLCRYGDFDQDGKPDIVGITDFGAPDISSFTVWLNLTRYTSTSLTASTNIALAGQPVTFTASTAQVLPNPGTPVGEVEFRAGNVVLGNAPLDGLGVATLVTNSLPVGPQSVRARYLGNFDSGFGPSHSTLASAQIIATPLSTATALTTSANPAQVGSPITLTATVTANGFVPTGAVVFRDKNQVIGSVSLDANGKAFFTPSLAVGTHMLTAAYQGTSVFVESVSTGLKQQIKRN